MIIIEWNFRWKVNHKSIVQINHRIICLKRKSNECVKKAGLNCKLLIESNFLHGFSISNNEIVTVFDAVNFEMASFPAITFRRFTDQVVFSWGLATLLNENLSRSVSLLAATRPKFVGFPISPTSSSSELDSMANLWKFVYFRFNFSYSKIKS